MSSLKRIIMHFFAPPLLPNFEHLKPRQISGLELISAGDESHEHDFSEVPWDSARLGSNMINMDNDTGSPLEFPKATYKYLHRCPCGAEGITQQRALI